ncbi:hypothetical protein [Nonomuraea sp. GTA35]
MTADGDGTGPAMPYSRVKIRTGALTGAWVYPGGGGYDSNAERVD